MQPKRPFRRYWKGGPNAAKDPKVQERIGRTVSKRLATRKEFGQPIGRPRNGETYEDGRVNFEGQRVLDLRRQGKSIRAIADEVDWSKNTVWSFLRRHSGGE